MAEKKKGILGRLFSRASADSAAARTEFTLDHTAVGLCFGYERGMQFGTEAATDLGTEHVLSVLKKYGLRATFFCPAKLCEICPDQISKLAQTGHEIAALGHADENTAELHEDAIKQLAYAVRNAFTRRGLHPIGFRSPHSSGNPALSEALIRQGFRYSAEHDHARHPYILLPGTPPLVRVPVYTDDKGLRRVGDTYDLTLSKHLRRLRRAIELKSFVSICFHPHILAEEEERMVHWESWLEGAVRSGARIGAMEDVLPSECRAR